MIARDWFALAVLWLTSAMLARTMIQVGVMDIPTERKAHARPTPKAGGIGAIGACLVAIPLFSEYWTAQAAWALAGAVCLGVLGFMDDLRDRGVGIKLATQIIAAIAVVSQGSFDAGGWGMAGPILAVGWLVFITNAFNFMDGSDGLAAGAGLIAAAFLAAAAPSGGAVQAGALALAAGLAGFLPFNLPPARLFLGDTGSQFCGFLLGVLGLGLAQEAGTVHSLWLLPLLLGGMIVDVGFTLARRIQAGARITTAHREHFYQRASFPAWVVMLAHWGLALLGALTWVMLDGVQGWLALPLWGLAHGAWLGFTQAGGVRIRP